MLKWLKHAFAIEPDGPAQPNDSQRAAVERICQEIVRRHLTTPTLVFLESARPLNYLGAQALHFFAPFASVLTDREAYQQFASFLEQRGSVDYLYRRLEELEAAAGKPGDQATCEKAQSDEDSGADDPTTDSQS